MIKDLMENKKVHGDKIGEFFSNLGVGESFLSKAFKIPKLLI